MYSLYNIFDIFKQIEDHNRRSRLGNVVFHPALERNPTRTNGTRLCKYHAKNGPDFSVRTIRIRPGIYKSLLPDEAVIISSLEAQESVIYNHAPN